MPPRKQAGSQDNLPFSQVGDSPRIDLSRTLEVRCGNCQARFVAWYGTEEEQPTGVVDVERCGLCGGDAFKKDNFKDAVLRLVAMVTARNVKRD